MKKPLPGTVERKKKPEIDPGARAWFMIFVVVSVVGMMIYIDFNRRFWNAPAPAPIAGRQWGDPDALLKIIEFLDFESPEIIRGQQMLYEFMQRHPENVSLQVRYFPQEDKSLSIIRYAECANQQNKFPDFIKLVFERDYQLSALPGLSPILNTIAADIGLDKDKLKACLTNRETTAVMAVDRIYGESLGVRSSPTYFFNGKIAVGVQALEKAMKDWDEILLHEE